LIRAPGGVVDAEQTSRPCTSQTRFEWIPDGEPPSFRIINESGPVMTWRIAGVEGHKYFAPDPYARPAAGVKAGPFP
jgi:hypothetical protein